MHRSTRKLIFVTIILSTLLTFTWHQPLNSIIASSTAGGRAEVRKHFPMPPFVGDLTWDGEYLWALVRYPATILRLDPNTGNVLDNITSPTPFPYGIAWDGEAMWISDDSSSQVYQFNITSGQILAQLNGTKWGEEEVQRRNLWQSWLAGMDCNGTHLWITARLLSTIFLINTSDGSILDEISGSIYPMSVDVHEDYLWISDYAISRVDKLAMTGGISLDHFIGPGFAPEGIVWGEEYFWIVDNIEGGIFEVDPSRTGPLGTPTNPTYFGIPLWAWFLIVFVSIPIILSTIANWRIGRHKESTTAN